MKTLVNLFLILVAMFAISGVGFCDEAKLNTVARVVACEDGLNETTMNKIISVIHNRAEQKTSHKVTLSDLYAVVTQKGQFDCYSRNYSVKSEKLNLAKTLVNNSLTGGWVKTLVSSTHFHNYSVKPLWSSKLRLEVADGRHRYYYDPKMVAKSKSFIYAGLFNAEVTYLYI